MAVIPANIAIAWPSTAASIPSGWLRETTLDSRYILGAAAGADTDLITDRGNATHSHVSPSHTPTQNAHTHIVTGNADPTPTFVDGLAGGGTAADDLHGHVGAASDAATGTNQGIAITVDVTTNDLSYVDVIWIKSNGTPVAIPVGALAFFSSDTLPPSWSRVNGNRYLRGASVDGGATGGSLTHTHTSPAHTHTQNTHTHSATSGTPTSAVTKGVGSVTMLSNVHIHNLDIDSELPVNQSVTTTINSSNHEPPFYKVNTILCGIASLPTGIICLWLGTNSTIPTGWARVAALNSKWPKASNANGEVASTGGGTSHTHTATDCQPIQNPHSHPSVQDLFPEPSVTGALGILNNFAANPHTHTWVVDSETATNSAVTVTISANTVDSAYPKHRTVIFVSFSPTSAVYTSYDINRFQDTYTETRVPEEVEAKVRMNDRRFMRQEETR